MAMAIAALVIAIDFSAVNVALPRIESDFGTDVNAIQWVVNAYTLTFGVLIVSAGRLADMFGRRRAFVLGAVIFAAMSGLAGIAPASGWLIAARALMGVGAALMWPAMLGMTYALLPARAGMAGGLIAGAGGIGNSIGPLIGGVLTDVLSWRWIFLINVPIAVFAVVVTLLAVHLHEPTPAERGIDWAGLATLSAGLLSLLFAVGQARSWGWVDPRLIGLLVFSAISLLAFGAIERREGSRALVPRALMESRTFIACCLGLLFTSGTFFASLLYLPQFMEHHLGYSPLQAGVGILPLLATFALVSFAAGPLYDRLGARPLAVLGAGCLTLAPVLLSLVGAASGYGSLVAGMVALGIGIGCFLPTATTAGVKSVDPSRASLAGGIVFMFQIGGGAIGVGLTTTAFSAAIPTFVDGIQAAFRLDAALSLIGFLIALRYIGGQPPSEKTV